MKPIDMTPSLAVKLGSLIWYYANRFPDEGPGAVSDLMEDPDVKTFMDQLSEAGLLPELPQ